MKADIIIIGGGIVGSSIAYHLSQLAGAGTLLVLERDHTYTHAATPLANGAYQSLDLECFGYRRILENRPYREKGII